MTTSCSSATPKSEHAADAQLELARLYEATAEYEEAALQLLEVIATFVRDGEGYRLELSSNSIDFAKGLGHELPPELRWDSLLELVAEFIGAPSPATWS